MFPDNQQSSQLYYVQRILNHYISMSFLYNSQYLNAVLSDHLYNCQLRQLFIKRSLDGLTRVLSYCSETAQEPPLWCGMGNTIENSPPFKTILDPPLVQAPATTTTHRPSPAGEGRGTMIPPPEALTESPGR